MALFGGFGGGPPQQAGGTSLGAVRKRRRMTGKDFFQRGLPVPQPDESMDYFTPPVDYFTNEPQQAAAPMPSTNSNAYRLQQIRSAARTRQPFSLGGRGTGY